MKQITPSMEAQVERITRAQIRKIHLDGMKECARLYSLVQVMCERGMDASSVQDVARQIRLDLDEHEATWQMCLDTYLAVRALADDVERALEVGHE